MIGRILRHVAPSPRPPRPPIVWVAHSASAADDYDHVFDVSIKTRASPRLTTLFTDPLADEHINQMIEAVAGNLMVDNIDGAITWTITKSPGTVTVIGENSAMMEVARIVFEQWEARL